MKGILMLILPYFLLARSVFVWFIYFMNAMHVN